MERLVKSFKSFKLDGTDYIKNSSGLLWKS
jgi:hypothetical protein